MIRKHKQPISGPFLLNSVSIVPRSLAGRERIYLDRFWNEFAGDPSKIDEATRVHYTAFYAQPGAMHSAFAQFLSIPKDAEDNKVSMTTKLTMPVLAIGG